MKKWTIGLLAIQMILLCSCQKDDTLIVTSWIGLQTKENGTIEKMLKTKGDGVGPVTWWAGGYTWQGGYFIVELIDMKKNETVLHKVYRYGDSETGNDELPKFKWWHSEEKDRIILAANRAYKMKLQAQGLAQPGAGWGLWLYEIREEPKRRESRRE
ncbi:hypothetical protein EH222_11110 [candidate division KSB1 bacterium]|nr:MAG: hypothetical protein EH222_11110 [candidate division KSB1 bacterium]